MDTFNKRISDATFSACRTYRYSLWRQWGEEGKHYVMFICLNPSTADEVNNDGTVERCMAFARFWGYDAMCMVNLFAYCTTDPYYLLRASEPVGQDNDKTIKRWAADAKLVVAAWGTKGTHQGRDAQVKALVPHLHCLRLTKDGHPSHPLYLPSNLKPVPFTTELV